MWSALSELMISQTFKIKISVIDTPKMFTESVYLVWSLFFIRNEKKNTPQKNQNILLKD